jgi:hypothetical protein
VDSCAAVVGDGAAAVAAGRGPNVLAAALLRERYGILFLPWNIPSWSWTNCCLQVQPYEDGLRTYPVSRLILARVGAMCSLCSGIGSRIRRTLVPSWCLITSSQQRCFIL